MQFTVLGTKSTADSVSVFIELIFQWVKTGSKKQNLQVIIMCTEEHKLDNMMEYD